MKSSFQLFARAPSTEHPPAIALIQGLFVQLSVCQSVYVILSLHTLSKTSQSCMLLYDRQSQMSDGLSCRSQLRAHALHPVFRAQSRVTVKEGHLPADFFSQQSAAFSIFHEWSDTRGTSAAPLWQIFIYVYSVCVFFLMCVCICVSESMWKTPIGSRSLLGMQLELSPAYLSWPLGAGRD